MHRNGKVVSWIINNLSVSFSGIEPWQIVRHSRGHADEVIGPRTNVSKTSVHVRPSRNVTVLFESLINAIWPGCPPWLFPSAQIQHCLPKRSADFSERDRASEVVVGKIRTDLDPIL